MQKIKYTLSILLISLIINQVHASHSVGADLTYTCVDGDTYEITLTFYRDCSSSTPAPGSNGDLPEISIRSATCNFNTNITLSPVSNPDGTFTTEISPICDGQLANSTCNGGPLQGVEQYIYTGTYTFPQKCKDWVLSYSLCCRNAAITNSPNADNYDLYLESLLNNLNAECNNSPVFTTLPVPYICVGQPFNYNHGVFDIEGDSLVYTLTDPLNAPNDPVPYVTGLSSTYPITTNPPNGVTFDIDSGQMSLTPNQIQIGIVAVLVEEYRDQQLIGSSRRDMQVIVINCNNNVPIVNALTNISGGEFDGNTFQVCAGNTLSFDIQASDDDAADILSAMDNLDVSLPGATLTTAGTNPITISFNWTTTTEDAGNHSFAITIEDDACPVTGFQVLGYGISVPGVQIEADDTLICPGFTSTIQLDANPIGSSNEGTFTWSPATGLSDPNIRNPIATISQPMTYTVVYDDGVCTVFDEVNIQTEGTLEVSPPVSTVCTGAGAQLSANYIPTVAITGEACGAIPANCADTPQTFTLGEGFMSTGPTNIDDESGTPYLGFFHDGRTQILYTRIDLEDAGLTAGLITEFALDVSIVTSLTPYQDFTIKMGCTDIFSFQNGDDFTPNLDIVYNDEVSPIVGWNIYVLDTPFQWDGTSNLLVEICFDNNSWTSYDHVFYTETSYNSVIYAQNDNDAGCFIDAEDVSNRRPNTRFTTCELEPTLNINYTWLPSDGLSNPNIANPIASPTQSTTYTVVATTPNGCELSNTVQVNIEEFSIEATPNPLSCGSTTGSIELEMTGGTAPYTFDWNNDALDGIEDPMGLLPGMYSVTVTDINACENTAFAEIIVTANLALTINTNDISCFGENDGMAEVSVTAGVEPFTYVWDSGLAAQSTQMNLAEGTYNVTVADAVGCQNTASIGIIEPTELVAIPTVQNVICGGSVGAITLAINGGTGAYTYLWDNGLAPEAEQINLAAGMYSYTVTDENNCQVSNSIMVNEPADALTLDFTANDVTCFGMNDGQIALSPSGGTLPYTFTWSDNLPPNDTLTNLGGGVYTLTFNDANDCTFIQSIPIDEPDALIAFVSDSTSTSCGSTDDGTATLSVSGGVSPYTFLWDNGENTPSANMLTQGIHSVSITDSSACTTQANVNIDATAEISMSATAMSVSCYGENDGSISIEVTDGSEPFLYSIDGEMYGTSSLLTNLNGGTYNVHVQDINGCIQTDSVTVDSPSELLINLIENTNINFGDSIVLETAVSGASGVTYAWSSQDSLSCTDCPSPTVAPTFQTAYTLNVTSNEGCSATASVTIFVDKNQPIFIPNAFSPNDDGINDFFVIHGDNAVANVKMLRIYDRWGGVIFESKNSLPNSTENAWDGTFRGSDMQSGVYVYYAEVEFVDGSVLPYSGDVVLVR